MAGDTGDHTHVLTALLSHQTVRLTSAGITAGTGLTGAATLAVVIRATTLAVPDTGPLVQGAGDEALQTLALRLSVPDLTLSVGTAGIKTNVLAPPVNTETFIRAVTISTRAASFRETPGLVGVAHLTLRTETTEPGGGGPAGGGTVAGLAAAGI